MNAEDFKTGTSVKDEAGRPGIVITDNDTRRECPGLVPVQWDSGARTMHLPGLLTPLGFRSASPQAGRGQTAGTSTPQAFPATTDSVGSRSGLFPVFGGETAASQRETTGKPDQLLELVSEVLVELRNVRSLVEEANLARSGDQKSGGYEFTFCSSPGGAEVERGLAQEFAQQRNFNRPNRRGVEVEYDVLRSKTKNDSCHETSPSVGAPDRAVCDSPEPTDGDSGGAPGAKPGALSRSAERALAAESFKTGDRVSADLCVWGTVVMDNDRRLKYPGSVPVRWDDDLFSMSPAEDLHHGEADEAICDEKGETR